MEDLRKAARELLRNNERTQELNGRTYFYTVPSVKTYPFQWSWDSCFHAIVYATLGEPERAKEELRSLLSAQREDGFIPHMIFWDQSRVRRSVFFGPYQESRGRCNFLPWVSKPKHTELIQPPLLAQAVERIFRTDQDRGFLLEVMPKLNRYYRWLLEKRDPDGDNLITIIAAFESGLDWSPAYDPTLGLQRPAGYAELVLRGRLITFTNKVFFNYHLPRVLQKGLFHVEDVLVNSIFGLNLRILAWLNTVCGNPQGALFFQQEANAVTIALLRKCYDRKQAAFFNLSGRNERRFPVLTIHSLMPLILPDLPAEIAHALVERHIKNPREFLVRYPLPSIAVSEPTFSAESFPRNSHHRSLWRGPTWINTNWYIIHGLRQHGYYDLAEYIAEKSRELATKNGFREYSNPFTGEGYGAENFGWSTLVVDM